MNRNQFMLSGFTALGMLIAAGAVAQDADAPRESGAKQAKAPKEPGEPRRRGDADEPRDRRPPRDEAFDDEPRDGPPRRRGEGPLREGRPGGERGDGPRGEGRRGEGRPGEGRPGEGRPRDGLEFGDEDRPPRGGEGGPLGRPLGLGPMRGPLGEGRGFRDLEMLRSVDPDMAKAIEEERDCERKVVQAVLRYRRASAEAREGIKKELKEIVTKQFAARQRRRELEIKRVEEELSRLRESVKKRNDTKDKIIDNRVKELIDDSEEPGF